MTSGSARLFARRSSSLAPRPWRSLRVNLNLKGWRPETRKPTVTARRTSLDTFDGSIEVHSWDRNEVEVEIEKRAMDETIDQIKVERTTGQQDHRQDHGAVEAGVSRGDDPARVADGGVRVALPRAEPECQSGDGSIRVEEVDGKIVLHQRQRDATRLSGDIGSDPAWIHPARSRHSRIDLGAEDGSIGSM